MLKRDFNKFAFSIIGFTEKGQKYISNFQWTAAKKWTEIDLNNDTINEIFVVYMCVSSECDNLDKWRYIQPTRYSVKRMHMAESTIVDSMPSKGCTSITRCVRVSGRWVFAKIYLSNARQAAAAAAAALANFFPLYLYRFRHFLRATFHRNMDEALAKISK